MFCIKRGRQTFSELLEFCEEVLHIAKEFALPPRNFKERIGGLYLLYGLYYKMPIKDMVRIRVTLEQWSHFLELQEQLKAGEHVDANFVLSTMIHDDAFSHTIFDFEVFTHFYIQIYIFFRSLELRDWNREIIKPNLQNLANFLLFYFIFTFFQIFKKGFLFIFTQFGKISPNFLWNFKILRNLAKNRLKIISFF